MPTLDDRGAFQQSDIEIIVVPKVAVADVTYETLHSQRQQQRASLFYDESISVLIVVRSPLSGDSLTACLSTAQLSASAHLQAYPAHHAGNSSAQEEAPLRFTLDSVLTPSNSPLLVHQVSSESSVAVFHVELHLCHPERPLSRPQLTFTASVMLGKPKLVTVDPGEAYLAPGVPASANLLLPLLSAPDLEASSVHLPVSRLEKVVPTPIHHGDPRPIHGVSPVFAIGPAVLLKISRTLFIDGVYFTVMVQIPESPRASVELLTVEARVHGTQATALTTAPLPTTMSPGDRTSYIIRADAMHGSSIAQFRITASILETNHGLINLTIKRSLGVPHQLKSPSRDRAKFWSSPRNPARPISSVSSRERQSEAFRRACTVTVSAPHRVEVDQVFKAAFLIINNSTRKRRLAILAPPVGNIASVVAPTSSRKEEFADAVLDQRDIFLHSTGSKSAEAGASRYRATTIPIDTELKLGVLQPGTSHEAAMRIRAITTGLITLEGILVIDLDTKESCMIGEGWEGMATESIMR